MKKFTFTLCFLFAILISKAQSLFTQNFNTLPFPPAGWNISASGSGGGTWGTTAGTGVTNAQAYVQAVENFNYNEGLYTPTLNLIAGDIISINFDYTKTNATPGVLKLVRATAQTNASSTVIQTISLVTNVPTAHSFSYTVPATGSFYIGFLFTDYFPSGGGAANTFLSIDNVVITKTGSAPTACSGTPPAGSSSGPATDNYTENGFTITHTNPSTLTGFTYQWQKQIGTGTWANLTGTGNTALTMNFVRQDITTNYRMITTCTNSGLTATSTPFTVVSPVPAYATLPITEYFETNWLSVHALRDAPNSFSKTVPSSGQRSARREDDPSTINSANWLSPNTGVAGITPAQGSHCARFHTTAAFFQPDSYLDIHYNGTGSIYKKIIYLENGATEGDALLPEVSIDGGQTFANLIVNSNEPTGVGTWRRKTIYFTATASTSATSIFRLRALNNDLPSNNSDIFLDSLAIFNIPACTSLPTNVEARWGENYTTCNGSNYTLPATVCAGQTLKLYANHLPPLEGGVSFYWEIMNVSTSGLWQNIGGSFNNPTVTVTITEASSIRIKLTCSDNATTQPSANIITVNLAATSECFANNVPYNPVIISQQDVAVPTKKYFNNKHAETPFGNINVGCNWDHMHHNLWYQFVATAPTVNLNMSEVIITAGSPFDINYALYKNISNVFMGVSTACGSVNIGGGTALKTITGLTVGTTYLLRLGMYNCQAAIAANLWLTVPSIANTPANICTPVNGVTINTAIGNNAQWVNIYYNDESNIVAEINANGNDLNAVTAQVYRNTSAIRTTLAGMPYLDRNVQISVATQPTGAPVSVRIYITQAEFDALNAAASGGLALSNLMLTKLSGACASTISSGGTILNTTVGSNGSNYYVEFDVTSFSTFFVHGPGFVLPVNLISFTATPKNNYNSLAWNVSDAVNFKHFEIERSDDGINFEKINTVAYTNVDKYNFNDYKASSAISFYKLKMVNANGSFSYSNIVKCKGIDKNTSILLQNPVQQTLAIKRNANTYANIQIYNSTGQKLIQQISTDYFVKIPINKLANGLYNCTITTNSVVEHFKFIKN